MPSPPRIRATLADGRVIEGPIGGYGGKLGAGCLLSDRCKIGVERRLAYISRHEQFVEIFPNYCAATDGEPVEIPVAGTRFEVLIAD